MNKKKIVCIISGGMDSVTLLYKAIKEHNVASALSYNYGQRHSRELEFAKENCYKLGVEHKIIDLTSVQQCMRGSALTDTDNVDVPKGHYADETMKMTVVPNRNMIMISIAVAEAVSKSADTVWYGAHSGDHAIYPDCRKEFIEKLSEVTKIANYQSVTVEAPFIDIDKGDIAIIGKELKVDYKMTHTCYEGHADPCGKCGACVERAEAMKKAGITDPLVNA
tara:strand:+ start:990 stop:1655 length:666 start_codon:yes stop_codon:yes gene_type:complete